MRTARQCCSLLHRTQTLLKLLQIMFFQPILQTSDAKQLSLWLLVSHSVRSHKRKARVQKCQAQYTTDKQPGLTSVSRSFKRPSQCQSGAGRVLTISVW